MSLLWNWQRSNKPGKSPLLNVTLPNPGSTSPTISPCSKSSRNKLYKLPKGKWVMNPDTTLSKEFLSSAMSQRRHPAITTVSLSPGNYTAKFQKGIAIPPSKCNNNFDFYV